jgi:hypothetical protein
MLACYLYLMKRIIQNDLREVICKICELDWGNVEWRNFRFHAAATSLVEFVIRCSVTSHTHIYTSPFVVQGLYCSM